ncbi:MAG: hypothetical protein K0R39_5061 [Symbiobacteriaceae bacterium]|jgi:hypothetical protein|nr:hypothetical protein [Symbiobacteriaceae bacterium]
MNISPIEVLLLLGLLYLMYKVNKLERMLEGGAAKRRPVRVAPQGDGKVIPILKEQIEPGPFKPERK